MSDRLVDLAANPTARRWVQRLGLPIPLPQTLERMKTQRPERALADRTVICGGAGALVPRLASWLPRLGAVVAPVGLDKAVFVEGGAAWSRAPVDESDARVAALVFDGTQLCEPHELDALHTFFHSRLDKLQRCGRVVVFARPHAGLTPRHSATQRALEGFVRSLAKELGRKGSTANLIVVKEGAEERVAPVLRFLLTPASVYVSGQVFRVSKTVRGFEDPVTRPLDGKFMLVTGAARGIGAATARVLAAEGAKVVVLDRPEDAALASSVAAEVGGTVFLGDVTDPQTGPRLVEHIQTHHGSLHGIVHNAGVTRDKTLARMKPELWNLTLDVNLEAVVLLTDALIPVLGKQARIVCLSSIAGIAGNVGQTNYAASKAGVIGFVEASAPAFARKGIAINAIAPGFIETRLTDAIPVATREAARRLCSLSQGGLPEDVAQAITFLSTPGAAALCGQTVRVCGGSFIGA